MFTITEPYNSPLMEFEELSEKATLHLTNYSVEVRRIRLLSGCAALIRRDIFVKSRGERTTILLSTPVERGDMWIADEVEVLQ